MADTKKAVKPKRTVLTPEQKIAKLHQEIRDTEAKAKQKAQASLAKAKERQSAAVERHRKSEAALATANREVKVLEDRITGSKDEAK